MQTTLETPALTRHSPLRKALSNAHHYSILALLNDQGASSFAEIREKLTLTRANLEVCLHRLRKDGLIESVTIKKGGQPVFYKLPDGTDTAFAEFFAALAGVESALPAKD